MRLTLTLGLIPATKAKPQSGLTPGSWQGEPKCLKMQTHSHVSVLDMSFLIALFNDTKFIPFPIALMTKELRKVGNSLKRTKIFIAHFTFLCVPFLLGQEMVKRFLLFFL